MVLEVSSTVPQASFGNAKCFDYSKTGARPKTQQTWTSSASAVNKKSTTSTTSSAQQQQTNKNGAWGPVFKNKQNFVDMHMF